MADKKQDSEKLAKRLGKRIAERRKQIGWTQEQLAERMRVDPETISRFERGVNLPSLPTLERMAVVLKIGVGDLLSPGKPAQVDEATRLATMIGELPATDRAFIVEQVSGWCEYFRGRSKR